MEPQLNHKSMHDELERANESDLQQRRSALSGLSGFSLKIQKGTV